MIALRILAAVGLGVALGAAPHAQQAFADSQAITEFQRALDGYAFAHRQAERRAGDRADQAAMAAAMRAVRPSPQDGDIFTPLVAASFRARILKAQRAGCTVTGASDSFVVPRPNQSAAGTTALAPCLTSLLPKLPAEIEYRAVGAVLLLVDTHANLVIDVLHGAFAHAP